MDEPAHRAARIGRDVVEEVLLELRRLGRRVDRAPIVGRLEDALAALHRLEESHMAGAEHLEAAREGVRLALSAIEEHDESPRALRMKRRLGGVERGLATVRLAVAAPEPEVPELRAVSIGAPHLHRLERAPMRPSVDVSPDARFLDDAGEESDERPEAEDDDVAPEQADSDAARRSPARVDAEEPSGVAGEVAQLERLARSCLEDIGAMANLRRLGDDERYDWTAMRRFEQRLCDCLDAAVALGRPGFSVSAPGEARPGIDILEQAVRYGRETVTADPGRAFARALVLGAIAGEDTVRAAVLALRQSPPYTYPAQTTALALAPNPAIGAAMARLCHDEEPRLARLALDVLCARGEVAIGVVVPLLDHGDELVRAAAARALGMAREREAARQLLCDTCEAEIDDDVFVAAAEALVQLGGGVEVIRVRLSEDADDMRADLRTRLMHVLGFAGGADDHALLERLYAGDRDQALALGFHGHPQLCDLLVDALPGGPRHTSERAAREAALALVRITGAPLGEPDERDRWTSWWQDNRQRFEPAVRYRLGRPWTALAAVDELEKDGVPMRVRRLCARELGHLLDERRAFAEDLAARQAELLTAARRTIVAADGEGRFAPGCWPS